MCNHIRMECREISSLYVFTAHIIKYLRHILFDNGQKRKSIIAAAATQNLHVLKIFKPIKNRNNHKKLI